MNDTKKLDVETCIDELKEIVLDALVEPKRKGDWLGPSDVRDEAGIHDYFQDREARRWTTPFTRAILFELKKDGLVMAEKCGRPRNGEPTLAWQLTNKGYQECLKP